MTQKAKVGRKPYKDRSNLKVQVPLYIPIGTINNFGGLEALRDKLIAYLDESQGKNK